MSARLPCVPGCTASQALECWHVPIPGVDPGLLGVLTVGRGTLESQREEDRAANLLCVCVCVVFSLLKQVLFPAVRCVGTAGG